MSIITLTDRISVSVRAKNDTEKSAQNKATGANIQKALGGSGLSDTDLEEIGNVNSVTDEDGNEWIPMNDWIGAGRKMKEKGAFRDKQIYKYGNVACIPLVQLPSIRTNAWYTNEHYYSKGNISHGPVGVDKDGYNGYVSSNDEDLLVGWIHNINNDSYTFLFSSQNSSPGFIYETENSSFEYIEDLGVTNLNNWAGSSGGMARPVGSVPVTDVGVTLLSLPAYGDYHVEEIYNNSLIDWDAPNAEVERQIKEVRDTYYDKDVDQYFVLAGPIEYGSEGDAPDDNPNS